MSSSVWTPSLICLAGALRAGVAVLAAGGVPRIGVGEA